MTTRHVGLAFDRATVRTYDRDGRMHVEVSNISKATVNPYLGREIPGFEELGLQPDRLYQLFRDPEELAKAAATFNNIPLLSRHVPVNARDHQPGLVIGSTGTDADFVSPYLRNSLVIWASDSIEDVESEIKKELSSAYHYTPVMEPGEFDGTKYDGRMTQIVGNHVALVKDGRAGSDVVVGDSNEEIMKHKLTRKGALIQGALVSHIAPKLAQDAKLDLTSALVGVTSANFAAKKAGIVTAVKALTAGKLAMDADIGDLVQLLDAVEGVSPVEATDTEEPALPVPGVTDPVDPALDADAPAAPADPVDACMAMVAGLSPEDRAKLLAALTATPAEPAAPVTPPTTAAEDDLPPGLEKKKDDDMVTKPAMDAALAAVSAKIAKTHREIREAERAVRPFVGDLAIACDSAEAVYRTALTNLGFAHESIHASALPAILSMQPKAGAKATVKPTLAQDAAAAASFATRFPGAGTIGHA